MSTLPSFTTAELDALSEKFETRTPQEIIRWAVETFTPLVALSSSFQTDSLPLLYMIHHFSPRMSVFFIDTGYHFWETLEFREMLERTWGLNVVDLTADETWNVFRRRFGRDLPNQDPNLCCFIHKVIPMQKAMKSMRAWITGIRRDQTPERAEARILSLQKGGLVKINPLLNWTAEDVRTYISIHELPEHPLLKRGYRSIGCAPCTRPVLPGEDERAGRWTGRGKRECGLHTEMFNQESSPAEVRKKFVLKLE